PSMIGSRETNALVLDEDGVASEHCMIITAGEDLFIVDLGSATGTTLNGETVTRNTVGAGSVLKIGGVTLRLVDAGGASRQASPKKRAKAPLAVDEVTDLNDLDSDEDDAPAPRPKKEAKRKRASARREKPKVRRDSPDPDEDDMPEFLDEEDGLGATLSTLEERAVTAAPKRQGNLATMLGAVAFVVALVVIFGASVTIISSVAISKDTDPAEESNRVANWSFEEDMDANKEIPGWLLERSVQEATFKIEPNENFGKKALKSVLVPGSEVKVVAKKAVVIEEKSTLTVSGMFAVEGKAVVGLELAWLGDGDVALGNSIVALSNKTGDFFEVSGTVHPPDRAVSAQLKAFAQSQDGATVFFDRLELTQVVEKDEDAAFQSLARQECIVECNDHGVATLLHPRKDGAGVDVYASGVQIGLVEGSGDGPLSYSQQEASRIDLELKKINDRIRYRGDLYDREAGRWRKVRVKVEKTNEGFNFNYTFKEKSVEADRRVFLRFDIPDARVVEPINFVDNKDKNDLLSNLFKRKKATEKDSKAAPEIWVKNVVEMAWGRNESQISLRFSSAATLNVRKVNKGFVMDVFLPLISVKALEERSAGFEVASSSSVVQTRIRSMFALAQKAQKAGDLGNAIKLYHKIRRTFKFDKAAYRRADDRVKGLESYAKSLVAEIRQAESDSFAIDAPEIEVCATASFKILETAYPDSQETRLCREYLDKIRARGIERTQTELENRAKKLLALGKSYESRQRVALARTALKLLVDFYPAEFQSVKDGQRILKRLEED
ncbi:MAG: FHA domain-containing protein, partial [Planctomycetota bacterium]|nr:FHA domain-containing protein [Planctomycetota bacterium]